MIIRLDVKKPSPPQRAGVDFLIGQEMKKEGAVKLLTKGGRDRTGKQFRQQVPEAFFHVV